MLKCRSRDVTWNEFAVISKTCVIFFIFSLYAFPAYATENRIMICGDYQYTPLNGYITKNLLIQNDSSFVILNPISWDNRTQEDIDIPTIYCLTEENIDSFEYKLSKKNEILIRTLAKQETSVKIVQENSIKIENGKIYFPLYYSKIKHVKDSIFYNFIIIEINEHGNKYNSIFVISPGNIDRDIETWPPNREEKRERMCARARALLDTIKKR